KLPPRRVGMDRADESVAGLALADAPSGHIRTCFRGNSMGNTIEPTADGIHVLNRTCLPRHDEKRGLERVLGVLFVTQHVAADAHDQTAMPFHQRGKSALLAVGGEALEQLRVSQLPNALCAG